MTGAWLHPLNKLYSNVITARCSRIGFVRGTKSEAQQTYATGGMHEKSEKFAGNRQINGQRPANAPARTGEGQDSRPELSLETEHIPRGATVEHALANHIRPRATMANERENTRAHKCGVRCAILGPHASGGRHGSLGRLPPHPSRRALTTARTLRLSCSGIVPAALGCRSICACLCTGGSRPVCDMVLTLAVRGPTWLPVCGAAPTRSTDRPPARRSVTSTLIARILRRLSVTPGCLPGCDRWLEDAAP